MTEKKKIQPPAKAMSESEVVVTMTREEFGKIARYSKDGFDKRGNRTGGSLLFGAIDKFLRTKGFDTDKGYGVDLGEPTTIRGVMK